MMRRGWSYGKKDTSAHNQPSKSLDWDYSAWPKNDYSPTLITTGQESTGIDTLEFAKAKVELENTIRGYLGL